MYISCGKTLSSVPRSMSPVKVKVKYQGHIEEKKTNIGHNFLIVSDRACILHMCISCSKDFALVPRSRPSIKVKVKYQGHIFFFSKMAMTGA